MVIMRSSSVRSRGGKTMEAGSGDNRYPPPESSSSHLTRHETIRWSQGSPGFIQQPPASEPLMMCNRQHFTLEATFPMCCFVIENQAINVVSRYIVYYGQK